MRHLKKGRKFSRTRNQRRAFLRALLSQLVTHGRIHTTEARAKELRPLAEKLVTTAKAGTLANRRLAASRISAPAVAALLRDIAPRYRERQGGYVRIIKLAPRKSDSARLAIIEFVK